MDGCFYDRTLPDDLYKYGDDDLIRTFVEKYYDLVAQEVNAEDMDCLYEDEIPESIIDRVYDLTEENQEYYEDIMSMAIKISARLYGGTSEG